MPLPPALAARLAKRGLIHTKTAASVSSGNFVEEVIAESYDDPGSETRKADALSTLTSIGHPGCPNKSNVYHTCSAYCVSKWGKGNTQPTMTYHTARLKMLAKYPLPSSWLEIYDPGSGRFFYWDTATDNVSWLSPKHPKAVIGKPASELRRRLGEEQKQPEVTDSKESESSKDNFAKPYSKDKDRSYDYRRKKLMKDSSGRKKKSGDDELDPMDPAAYSDIPRGGWSAGLNPDESRTGVDTTASGPLFQMRPYPSPGAVLRAQGQGHSDSKKS